MPHLAMDFKTTNRSYDADGRLHVASSNISKGNVCPYLGKEIPRWRELGLNPDRIYNLWRDPAELEKAVSTFNNLPVLSEHVPVDVDDYRPELVVGSTGTDAAMNGTFLTNSLVVWARPSIVGIESDEKRQLSSAYRYEADMTPGEVEGVAYDGRMCNIKGNHVALVFEGRAGSDVIVGDEKPMAIKSRRLLLTAGSLVGAIRPMLAQDAKFNPEMALDGFTAQDLQDDAKVQALADRVFGQVQPMLAADAKLDIPVLVSSIKAACRVALDSAEEVAEDEDDEDEDKPKAAADEDDDAVAEDEDEPMGAADTQALVAAAVLKERARSLAVRTAEQEVRPVVGDLPAMDSADKVYRAGLKALKVDYAGVPASALGALFRSVSATRSKAPSIAQDAALSTSARSDFGKRFPNAANIKKG